MPQDIQIFAQQQQHILFFAETLSSCLPFHWIGVCVCVFVFFLLLLHGNLLQLLHLMKRRKKIDQKDLWIGEKVRRHLALNANITSINVVRKRCARLRLKWNEALLGCAHWKDSVFLLWCIRELINVRLELHLTRFFYATCDNSAIRSTKSTPATVSEWVSGIIELVFDSKTLLYKLNWKLNTQTYTQLEQQPFMESRLFPIFPMLNAARDRKR